MNFCIFLRWVQENGAVAFNKVREDVIGHYISGKLKMPQFRKFPFAQWKEAVKHAMQGYTNEKVLIQLN